MDRYLLEMKMKQKGITNSELADKLKLSSVTLYRKKIGVSDFDRREILVIKDVLELSQDELDSIFFKE